MFPVPFLHFCRVHAKFSALCIFWLSVFSSNASLKRRQAWVFIRFQSFTADGLQPNSEKCKKCKKSGV